MSIKSWLSGLFGFGQNKIYYDPISQQYLKTCAMEYSNRIAQNYVSAIFSKCQFLTYWKGEKQKGNESYLWNYAPNPNQTAAEFKSEIVRTMLETGECLVIDLGGSLYIAEDYKFNHNALSAAIVSNVVIPTRDGGSFRLDRSFSMDDVLFFRLDDSEVERWLHAIDAEYQQLFAMARNKYTRAGGHHGIITLDSTARGDVEKQKKLQEALTDQFKSYYDKENSLSVLNKGMEYQEFSNNTSSSQNEINNIKTLVSEGLSMVARAYRIPPCVLSGDVADTSAALDQMITFCLSPIISVIEQEITRKRYGKEVLKGSYLKIDTSAIKYTDVWSLSSSIDKLLADGIYSIDEIREKVGDTPLNTEWSKKHWITKNYSSIESAGTQVQAQTWAGGISNGEHQHKQSPRL